VSSFQKLANSLAASLNWISIQKHKEVSVSMITSCKGVGEVSKEIPVRRNGEAG
jgi:hypothetical protein